MADMDVDDDQFWKELCSRLADAEQASRDELEGAERLLSELDEAEVVPLTRAQIDALKKAALAHGPAHGNDEVGVRSAGAGSRVGEHGAHAVASAGGAVLPGVVVTRSADGPSASAEGGRVVPLRRVQRFVAAAAMLAVAPKMLVAASVVAALTFTTMFLQNTAKTLPFQEAVQILVDRGVDQNSRNTALGRVFGDVYDAATRTFPVLRALGPEMAAHVDHVCGRLVAQIDNAEAFSMRRFDVDLPELELMAEDATRSDEDRHELLDRVAVQMSFGIAAMQSVIADAPGTLGEFSEVVLSHLRKALQP